jgi:hypothetical protein
VGGDDVAGGGYTRAHCYASLRIPYGHAREHVAPYSGGGHDGRCWRSLPRSDSRAPSRRDGQRKNSLCGSDSDIGVCASERKCNEMYASGGVESP